MKRIVFPFLLFLTLLLACEKTSIPNEDATYYQEEEVADENDLTAALANLPADDRAATFKITSVTSIGNLLGNNHIDCNANYLRHLKYAPSMGLEATLQGRGFGDSIPSGAQLQIIADTVPLPFDVVEWTDTRIVVSFFTDKEVRKNFLLKFRLTIDGKTKRKSLKASSGVAATIGEEEAVYYYPSARYNVALKMQADAAKWWDYELVDMTDYVPQVGDLLMMNRNHRAAYVTEVAAPNSWGNIHFRVSERNAGCNARIAHKRKYRVNKEGIIHPRNDEEERNGVFDVLYRPSVFQQQ